MIQKGQVINFENDSLPYKVMGASLRYAVCVRLMNLKEDRGMLQHQVDMDAYFSVKDAFDQQKDDPVYTVLDLVEKIRGPHNLVFNLYDLDDEESVAECIKQLESGEIEISSRNRIPLDIKL